MKLSRLIELLQEHLDTHGDPVVVTINGKPVAGYIEGRPTGPDDPVVLLLADREALDTFAKSLCDAHRSPHLSLVKPRR